MRKILLLFVAVAATIFSANAQVKIESPHPDLDIEIKRCAYASGTVVIDMVITNYGMDEKLSFVGSTNGNSTALAYDDEGNQYNNQNSRITLGLMNQALGDHKIIDMPQDVPLKFRIQITKVSNVASALSFISIPVYSSVMLTGGGKVIKIRNLEWSK